MASPPKINWDDAFAYFAALGPQRTYRHVVDRYDIGYRAVERHGRANEWRKRAAAIDEQARRKGEEIVVRDRTARVADTLRVIDASRIKFAQHLREQSFRLTGSDFVGLVKLEQLLEGEATDRLGFAEVQEAIGAVIEIAIRHVPVKKRGAFLEEVRGRLGEIGEAA